MKYTGTNLPDQQSKEDHVRSSFYGAISAIEKIHGRELANPLERAEIFFLSGIQKKLGEKKRGTRRELNKLLTAIAETRERSEKQTDYRPVYDVAKLNLAYSSRRGGISSPMESIERLPWHRALDAN